jgi:hypothetical protein
MRCVWSIVGKSQLRFSDWCCARQLFLFVCALPKQTSEVLVRLKLDYYRVLFRVRLRNFSGCLLRTLSAGSLLSSYKEQFLNFSYLKFM